MPAAHPHGSQANTAIEFANHAQHLSLLPRNDKDRERVEQTTAVEAAFVTPLDPVIKTADGHRLPTVPLPEAQKLNYLKDKLEGNGSGQSRADSGGLPQDEQQELAERAAVGSADDMQEGPSKGGTQGANGSVKTQSSRADASLHRAIPPTRTHPLFPPLPLYGPPTFLRNLQVMFFRVTSSLLSLAFLMVIVLGSTFTAIPGALRHFYLLLTAQNPLKNRPFHDEEQKRELKRRTEDAEWVQRYGKGGSRKRNGKGEIKDGERGKQQSGSAHVSSVAQPSGQASSSRATATEGQERAKSFEPTEGGPDLLVRDIGYYARRVGLDAEKFEVQTEDGFLIDLYHVYDPAEHAPLPASERDAQSPDLFPSPQKAELNPLHADTSCKKKYPVLLIHGLLQSMGAYCVNDDDSLAFYLCKQGYDVWLGNNRCGFQPKHTLLRYGDPRMWAWNIRQMGVMDLPALVSRVLDVTGFEKLGLVAHSQGTTQTFVALAKEQRPELGSRISVFCALAPAVYAGPLIDKMQFKWMRLWNPAAFRIWFGVLSFVPFMMSMHRIIPHRLYGALGYRVFAFLFGWSDTRWDRGLRNRLFQFSPVYVSAESMRWWLGRECFAKHRCILATREQERWSEEEENALAAGPKVRKWEDGRGGFEIDEDDEEDGSGGGDGGEGGNDDGSPGPAGSTAWYDKHAPPMALWIAGSDKLVDGWKLLRRLEGGREPNVRLVHSKVIREYEHLDVIWAMDAIEQVGCEVKRVIWQTMAADVRGQVQTPVGCEDI